MRICLAVHQLFQSLIFIGQKNRISIHFRSLLFSSHWRHKQYCFFHTAYFLANYGFRTKKHSGILYYGEFVNILFFCDIIYFSAVIKPLRWPGVAYCKAVQSEYCIYKGHVCFSRCNSLHKVDKLWCLLFIFLAQKLMQNILHHKLIIIFLHHFK